MERNQAPSPFDTILMKGFFHSSRVQVESPEGSLVPKCGACGLFKSCQSPKMGRYGDGRKKVLVVGEAPGQTEDEDGRPFIGKAGTFLRQCLRQIGADLDQDAWTTNSLICRPPKNTTPEIKQISYCRPNLLNTIKRFGPRVVLVLGKSALVSVIQGYWKTDLGALDRWVGWKIPISDHWICPTYHPSYLLRMKNPILDRAFVNHLRQAFLIDEDPPRRPSLEGKINVLYEEGPVIETLREMDGEGGWVAVDYETNCLKPDYPEARIVSCAVADGKKTISYPWTKHARKATGILLRSGRTRKIASNLKFEERWTLKEFGHGVNNWGWDTMLAAHCLDNRPHITSLKFQSLIQMGVPTYNENIEPYLGNIRGHYNRIQEVELRHLLFYGGMDALLEYRLAMLQRKEIGNED